MFPSGESYVRVALMYVNCLNLTTFRLYMSLLPWIIFTDLSLALARDSTFSIDFTSLCSREGRSRFIQIPEPFSLVQFPYVMSAAVCDLNRTIMSIGLFPRMGPVR